MPIDANQTTGPEPTWRVDACNVADCPVCSKAQPLPDLPDQPGQLSQYTR